VTLSGEMLPHRLQSLTNVPSFCPTAMVSFRKVFVFVLLRTTSRYVFISACPSPRFLLQHPPTSFQLLTQNTLTMAPRNTPAPGAPFYTPIQSPPSGTALEPNPPTLFLPLKIRDVTFHNRICMLPPKAEPNGSSPVHNSLVPSCPPLNSPH
jgi:hypothetical protein